MSHILIVDDEPHIRTIIGYVVKSTGHTYLEAENAEDARIILDTHDIELVLVDVMLPGSSGIELCAHIRATSTIPVIVISALSDEEDRIRGLEAGADDYISKPFSPKEVALRITAILRRNTNLPIQQTEEVHLNAATGEVSVNEQNLILPAMEARVLHHLLLHQRKTVSFNELLINVWGTSETIGGREMVRITVHRLRSHLHSLGVRDNFIETVRGTGYRIRNKF